MTGYGCIYSVTYWKMTPYLQEDKTWYIAESTWIESWLAFVHYNKTSPAPGPCRNDYLLRVDDENKYWLPKENLIMARKNGAGNYRRVSQEAWRQICALYPGSGPEISVDFKEVQW